ncbi:malate dehydrogenase, partial [Pseudomonas syringae]
RDISIRDPKDARVITRIPDAVAKAAIETGVATWPDPKSYPLKSVDDVFNG